MDQRQIEHGVIGLGKRAVGQRNVPLESRAVVKFLPPAAVNASAGMPLLNGPLYRESPCVNRVCKTYWASLKAAFSPEVNAWSRDILKGDDV